MTPSKKKYKIWFYNERVKKLSIQFFVFFIFSQTTLRSQESIYYTSNVGISVGANIALGTHFQRIGIVFNGYYLKDNVQANLETRFYFSEKNLGPYIPSFESVTSVGLVFGYGPKQDYFNPFINSISNQTGYRYCAAYAYNFYWNKINTKQRTANIALQFEGLTLITENDLLAPPSLDRFRTAAFLLQFQHKDIVQAAINCTMWTGKMGFKTASTNPHFYFGCYMDTTGSVFPNISFGLLSAQIKYNVGFSQNVQLNLGLYAEQVRNTMQNKLIHDMRFLPKKWLKGKNCHIPMIDENGNPYLYEEGQKIRKARLYLNGASNQSLFY